MLSNFTQLHAHFTGPGSGRGRAISASLGAAAALNLWTAQGALPENPAAVRLHASAAKAEKAGNIVAAKDFEQQAAHLSPLNVVYRGEFARLLWEAGFAERAILECKQALKLDPELLKLRFNLAVMLQATGDPKSAIAEYEKVLKSNANDVHARLGYVQSLALSGRSQEAVNQLDLLSAQSKKIPQILIEAADTAIQIDQSHRAKEMLRDPAASGVARAASLLYVAAANDNDAKLALSFQKKVLESAPKDARIYLIAARLAESKGGLALEEQILNQAMKSVRNEGDLYAQLAGIFLRKYYQARTSADETNAQAWLSLAQKALSFAEEIHVKAWRYRFAHAGVLSLQGKQKEAAEMIDALAHQEPKNELILYCRGRLRAYSNNPAAAARRNLKSLFSDADQAAASSALVDDGIILACSRAHFEKLGCGCHTAVLELKWKRSGGVLYAKIISEHPAVGLIVHQMGDTEGFKGRIISAASSINERVTKVETETVKGLGALAMNVVAPEAQELPPLMARLHPPELQRL
ncbi:MAG: hypothetical protein K2Y39_08740 [Candidatus Obscuribacterales bacterium]|nr:hypothetical protein [Candidatus Obscuribacterales bacterium]